MLHWSIIKRKLGTFVLIFVLSVISSCGGRQIGSNAANKNRQQATTRNADNRLKLIKKRGKLICGINDQLPGFSYKEEDGSYSGISVDLCRAIAVALFDDPTKVEFRHLDSEERFSAVRSGKVDILSRNTTWTLSRDTSGGLDFPPTNFYDGQGLLVGIDSGIEKLDDLDGKSVCVPSNTTSEDNLMIQMRKRNLAYTHIAFEDIRQVYGAYEILGLDPLYVANEGIFIAVVDGAVADDFIKKLKQQENCQHASIIGEVVKSHPKQVVLTSRIGGKRVVNMLVGEQLPRIC